MQRFKSARLCAEIPLNPSRRLQHLQRRTPSALNARAELRLNIELIEPRRFARVTANSHLHTALGRLAQRLDDRAVGQHIGRYINLLRGSA